MHEQGAWEVTSQGPVAGPAVPDVSDRRDGCGAVRGGALAGRAVLSALRLSQCPDIGINTTLENLLRAVVREVRIEYDENA